MKCYKGTDKNLKCHGFQYEVGKTYETPEARICETGFHACENPLDVFRYYAPADSRYFEVDLEANEQTENNDSKRVGSRIFILSEIGLDGIVQKGVEYIFSKIDWKNNAISNTGDQSAATNTGDWSAATNTGNRSAATNTGDWSAATNTGDWSAATNTGDWSAATNTGDQSAATNTGYQSAAINIGKFSSAEATGEDSIAIVTGYQGKAKGSLGCWLVLAERMEDGRILDVKAFQVDGVNILSDTYYRLENGALVVVDGNE